MHIGLLGGTFNPPHRGHEQLGLIAQHQLHLDELWLLPAAHPPHKQHLQLSDPGWEHRVNMCRLVAAEHGWDVCTVEARLPPPSYTSATLTALHHAYPDHRWTWIMGADGVQHFHQWHDPQTIIRLAQLAVSSRQDTASETAASLLRQQGADVVALAMNQIDQASSEIRDAWNVVHRDTNILPSVWHYAEEHQLYRPSASISL